MADGGARLDDATLADMSGVLKALAAIVDEGVRAGEFRPVNPLLVHAGIVGPVLLFFASDGIRRRVERLGVRGAATVTRDEVVAHVQRVALGLLEGRIPETGGGAGITKSDFMDGAPSPRPRPASDKAAVRRKIHQ